MAALLTRAGIVEASVLFCLQVCAAVSVTCPHKSEARLDNLLELRHDPELQVWDEGYDANGDWAVELARQTAARVVVARAAAKPTAAKKPTPAAKPKAARKPTPASKATPATTSRAKGKAPFDAGARERTRQPAETVAPPPVPLLPLPVQPPQRQALMEMEDLPSLADFDMGEEDEFGGASA